MWWECYEKALKQINNIFKAWNYNNSIQRSISPIDLSCILENISMVRYYGASTVSKGGFLA